MVRNSELGVRSDFDLDLVKTIQGMTWEDFVETQTGIDLDQIEGIYLKAVYALEVKKAYDVLNETGNNPQQLEKLATLLKKLHFPVE